jgi:hypothetical protein
MVHNPLSSHYHKDYIIFFPFTQKNQITFIHEGDIWNKISCVGCRSWRISDSSHAVCQEMWVFVVVWKLLSVTWEV